MIWRVHHVCYPVLSRDDFKAYPKTMSRQTIHFHCKELTHDGHIEYGDGRYWVPDRVKQEIRYFGTWFGEVAVSRLFTESVKDMTEFVNRVGAYFVYIFIEAMAPFSNKKLKANDKDMLAMDWVESAIPLRTLFWKFVQHFKGLEVVKGGHASRPTYELEDTSKLESTVKKLYPEIYNSLLETKEYMGIDRNKRITQSSASFEGLTFNHPSKELPIVCHYLLQHFVFSYSQLFK